MAGYLEASIAVFHLTGAALLLFAATRSGEERNPLAAMWGPLFLLNLVLAARIAYRLIWT